VQQIDIHKKQQAQLIDDIQDMLDSFIIGSIASPPSLAGYNLTTKVEGKTKTFYVRKNLVPKATEMSRRYKQLWLLLQALSKVNWEILNLENKGT
jgi:hypothetical protein